MTRFLFYSLVSLFILLNKLLRQLISRPEIGWIFKKK